MVFPEPQGAIRPLQQSGAFGRTLEHLSCKVRNIDLDDGTGRVGRAQVVLRRFGPVRLGWVPRGPVWAPGLDIRDKIAALRRLRATLPPRTRLLINCETAADAEALCGRPRLRMAASPAVAEWDLRPGPEALLAAQKGKWRNRLRHAQSGAMICIPRLFSPAHDMALLRAETAQRRDRGYAGYPAAFTLAWNAANPGAARIFVARAAGFTLAYMLVLTHGNSATYHAGWTSPRGRAQSAHNLLMWEAALWLRARGVQRFDLGLADPARAPGLTRFKLGSGARMRGLGSTYLVW